VVIVVAAITNLSYYTFYSVEYIISEYEILMKLILGNQIGRKCNTMRHIADVVVVITVKLTNTMISHFHSKQIHCDLYGNNCSNLLILWPQFALLH
jgi:hypothetical protein